ncbi:hypothetical protein [Nonomuraea lactucae]|uniref:hypothetical protein n=1 Tax=Nonomuraea lactucae TaxID=2249762 RepID=UPI001966B416|nr:hypothetical protein [Nonomuraea lactucae]
MRKATATPPALMASIALTLGLGAHPAWAGARTAAHSTVVFRAHPLEITVPNSANLGSGPRGGTISASLGTVTVGDNRTGNRTWITTVSATNFTTGSQSSLETIPKSNVAYWSGPVTAQSGGGVRTPGQPTAAQRVSLSTSATAFRASKGPAIASTTWQPTLVITIPAAVVSGVYTGTVTHSVA